MKKFVCTVCGYVYEGEAAPEFCPVCKAPKEKFAEQSGDMTWAAEHVVGVAKGVDPEDHSGTAREFQRRMLRGRHVSGHGARRTPRRLSRRSACTGKRPPMKRPSMPQSSPKCWAKS